MSTFKEHGEHLDPAIYDLELLKSDCDNGNPPCNSYPIGNYRKNYIVTNSAINGQWEQAKQQFKYYGMKPNDLIGLISDQAIKRIS